ncbi:hypothetical protein MMC21_000010 [Puttea exsequens]|nr:hypothetical protein [Puttea exsequens]
MYSAIQTPRQSLLDSLRLKNPAVHSKCKPGGNTKSKKHKWRAPRMIELWEDFDYESLKLIDRGALHGLLIRQHDLKDFSINFESRIHQPRSERSFEHILACWTRLVVNQALRKAQENVKSRPDRKNISFETADEAHYPDYNSAFRPDWAGVHTPDNCSQGTERSLNYLPGDSKVSPKWRSSSIENGEVTESREKADWLRPVSQIFEYMVQCKTRYGYIITDQELVAVRIRPNSKSSKLASEAVKIGKLPSHAKSAVRRTGDSGIFSYKGISWDNHKDNLSEGSAGLTVNLALWWLHMMAAGNTSIEDDYPPLPEDSCGLLVTGQDLGLKFSNLSGGGMVRFGAEPDAHAHGIEPATPSKGLKRSRDKTAIHGSDVDGFSKNKRRETSRRC